MEGTTRMEGTIKWYDPGKHIGFVKGEDGKDYFVHQSFLPEGFVPRENDKVTFEPTESERGLQAHSIKPV